MTHAELFAFLFSFPHAEAEEVLTRWSLSSRRFHSFLVEYRTKIRKKLRSARTPESLHSLLLELAIARHFVDDPRCQVEYEKYGQGRDRRPDLTLTFRTHTLLNLEVTQVHMPQGEAEAQTEKLNRLACEKLGQVVPQTLNCLVATEGGSLTEDALHAAMNLLKRRVEHSENTLLSRYEFNDPAAFYRQFQWLNGIVVSSAEEGSGKLLRWNNPQSRHSLPPDIDVLLQSMRLSPSIF